MCHKCRPIFLYHEHLSKSTDNPLPRFLLLQLRRAGPRLTLYDKTLQRVLLSIVELPSTRTQPARQTIPCHDYSVCETINFRYCTLVMLGGYQIPVVRTAIGTVADLIKSVVVTWPLESMGYYEYRRRATMKERTIMEVMMECEKIGSTAAMVVGAYGMRAPERIWPSWARCLPLPVLRAVASQSPLEVNASGWWKAFRELPRGALDSSIPLKCLRNQLHRGNLANACSLLHWEDPVTEAIKTDDIPLLIELQVAGEIFIRDESSLCNAISNGRFKSARFLINNDAAKWLLTVDQKSELLKALAEEDRIAASCIVVNAYNVRQLYNTALENIEEFRAKLTTTEVFKDDIRILLDNMKTFGNVFNDALETIMELRTRHFQQRIEGVLAVLLIYRTTKKMSPSKLGEPDLFSADIDRWRSRVEESKLGLFDEVVRLAWEKESHGQDWPELDFEKEFESIDATLRELLNQGLEKTITGLDDVAATQVGLPVQTCGPRLPTPMLSIQTSECGSSREPIWKAAIVLMAGVACAAVLLCTLILIGSYSHGFAESQSILSYTKVNELIQTQYLDRLAPTLKGSTPDLSDMILQKLEFDEIETRAALEQWLTTQALPEESKWAQFTSMLTRCWQSYLTALENVLYAEHCAIWKTCLFGLRTPSPSKSQEPVSQASAVFDADILSAFASFDPDFGGQMDPEYQDLSHFGSSMQYSGAVYPGLESTVFFSALMNYGDVLHPDASGDAGADLPATLTPPAAVATLTDPDTTTTPNPNSTSTKRKRKRPNDRIEYDRYNQVLKDETQLPNGRVKCNNSKLCGDTLFPCDEEIPEKNYSRHLREMHKKFQEGRNHFLCTREGCPEKGKVFKRKDRFKKHTQKHEP